MKKAVVIGGSSGIGLAISENLIQRGYYIVILSRHEPDCGILNNMHYEHHFLDLTDFDEDLVSSFADDPDVSVLVISSGIGRVADFEYFHISEIDRIMTINATATMMVLRKFYGRLKAKQEFHCGVLGSIAGLMSSPMSAVYAASKAALWRFTESVNIELEDSGTDNRILYVAPASFKGSRFYGEENHLELLAELADDIVFRLFSFDSIYIPQYHEVFKDVLLRYQSDPHEYGLYSYAYKRKSDRVTNENKAIIGYIAGEFKGLMDYDIRMIRRAKEQCDYLIMGVCTIEKSLNGGHVDKSNKEIIEIMRACKYIDKVVESVNDYKKEWEKERFNKLFLRKSDYDELEIKRVKDFLITKGVEIFECN